MTSKAIGVFQNRVLSLVFALVVLVTTIAPALSITNPRAHFINNVTWHTQLNALSCGAAALEIVYDYWGPDVDQKGIMNVARTSSAGTWTFDVERAGHFSYLSDAQGRFFPAEGPTGGFDERRLGYVSFSYSSNTCWFDELKTLIDKDIPVIVLMSYTPSGGGGHYRVVIGYDDSQQLIYFSDPWGRDTKHLTDRTGVINWSYLDFEVGWRYLESGSAKPYLGVAIMPWLIDVTAKGATTEGSVVTVTASIQYPCPNPFDSKQYSAKSAVTHITLPEGTTLLSGSATLPLDTLKAGASTTVTWKVLCNSNAAGKAISVSACGIVSGWVPEAHWQGETVHYPAYTYYDAIGGEARSSL